MSISSFKLSIPLKLLVVAIALIFPTVILLYLLMAEKDVRIDFGAKEIQGDAYLVPLKDNMRNASEHMLAHYRMLASGSVQKAELSKLQSAVSASLTALRQVDSKNGSGFAESEDRIKELEASWAQLTSKSSSLGRAASIQLHSDYIQKLRQTITYFGDQSNLILDPDLDTYYLMDLTLLRTPSIGENLYKMQMMTQEILRKESSTADEKTQLVVLLGLIRSDLNGLKSDVETAYANTKKPESLRQALDAASVEAQKQVAAYLDFIDKKVRSGEHTKAMMGGADSLFAKASASVYQLFDKSIVEEDKLLQVRIGAFEQSKVFTITWVLILIVAFLLLGSYFIAGILRAIRQLNDASRKVSEGFMDVQVEVRSGDELEVLAASFNQMIEQNNQTLMEVEMAKTTAEQEQDNLRRLVEETTNTVSELLSKQEIVSDNARIVAEAATEATEVSSTGEQAVTDSIDGVTKIKTQIESVAEKILELSARTQSIGEITATVDDIANQSKFLAFNASIEASKAGEFGKGFAIVANEIKNLSEESKEATEKIADILSEIQELTNTSVMLAEDATKLADIGVKLSNKSGEAITQLVFSIENSSEAAYQIASSSMEQQGDLKQLSDSMKQLVGEA